MSFIRSDSLKHIAGSGASLLFICSLGYSLTVTQTATGIALDVESTGAYTITTTRPAWTFSGTLAKTLTNILQVDSSDNIGAYTRSPSISPAPDRCRGPYAYINRFQWSCSA